MSCRVFTDVLRPSIRGNGRIAKAFITSDRSFTCSSILCRNGPIPRFPSFASSPELDKIMSDIRLQHILPAHLSKSQRDLMFKAKRHKLLEGEPVVVELNDEEFVLKPIRHGELTKLKPNLKKAFRLMDAQDCAVIPELLRGLKNAGSYVAYSESAAIIKVLRENRRQDVLMECLRRVEDTGFRLDSSPRLSAVLVALTHEAVESDYGEAATKKALSRVEAVAALLEEPGHVGKLPRGTEEDPRSQPELLGYLLQLSSVRAAKHQDGLDVDGKVAEYAGRLVDMPPFTSKGLRELPSLIQALHGMELALTVLEPDSETAKRLTKRMEELGKLVDEVRVSKTGMLPERDVTTHFAERLYTKLMEPAA